MARDRAALKQERETFEERARSVTADPDMRSAKIDEEKSSLQRVLQDHRELEEEVSSLRLAHSTCAHGYRESARDFEIQSMIETRVIELKEELDTKTAELKRLQDKEAARKDDFDVSHEELCAILHGQRRSQNQQELPMVLGEGIENGSKDLAGMLKDLLTSHARGVNEAKIMKDRQRKLQEENELLQQRLANAEAQSSTDRLLVETALSRMEDCVDPGVRMLKIFFAKQETRRESKSQKESSTSK